MRHSTVSTYREALEGADLGDSSELTSAVSCSTSASASLSDSSLKKPLPRLVTCNLTTKVAMKGGSGESCAGHPPPQSPPPQLQWRLTFGVGATPLPKGSVKTCPVAGGSLKPTKPPRFLVVRSPDEGVPGVRGLCPTDDAERDERADRPPLPPPPPREAEVLLLTGRLGCDCSCWCCC